jgi:glucose-6-phosphate 1-dehydrogenase
VEEFWASRTKPDQYPAGTAGPPSADALMARDNRAWRRL